MKRKLTANDDVTAFLEDSDASDSEPEFQLPPSKKRKLDDEETFTDGMESMDASELLTLKDIPFSTQELEDDFDEEEFMEKLSKHLEMKYDDDEKEVINTELSALDILTMDEKELNAIMPIHNDEDIDREQPIDTGFRYLPTFGHETSHKSDNKSKRKRKKRNANRYYKVPQPNKKKHKGPKKMKQKDRFILAQSKKPN